MKKIFLITILCSLSLSQTIEAASGGFSRSDSFINPYTDYGLQHANSFNFEDLLDQEGGYLSDNGIASASGLSDQDMYPVSVQDAHMSPEEETRFMSLAGGMGPVNFENIEIIPLSEEPMDVQTAFDFYGVQIQDGVLNLMNKNIDSLHTLRKIADIHTVTTLYLDGNKITHLSSADLQGLPLLKNLSLNNNEITSVDLSHKLGLETLSLSNNQISSLKAKQLRGVRQSLRQLYLDHNMLTTISDDLLNELQKLNVLTLSYNPIEKCSKWARNLIQTHPQIYKVDNVDLLEMEEKSTKASRHNHHKKPYNR